MSRGEAPASPKFLGPPTKWFCLKIEKKIKKSVIKSLLWKWFLIEIKRSANWFTCKITISDQTISSRSQNWSFFVTYVVVEIRNMNSLKCLKYKTSVVCCFVRYMDMYVTKLVCRHEPLPCVDIPTDWRISVQEGSPDHRKGIGLWLVLLAIQAVNGGSFNVRWS